MPHDEQKPRSPLKLAIGIVLALTMIAVGGLIGVSIVFLVLAPLILWSGPTLPLELQTILISGLVAGPIAGIFWARAMLKH